MPKKKQKYIKKNLIVDAAGDKIIFKIIDDSKNYTNEYENCRKNFDMFSQLLFKFLRKKNIKSVADLHNVLRTKILNFLFRITLKKVQFVKKGRSDRKKLTRRKNKIFKPLTPVQYKYCDVFRRLGFPVDLVTVSYTHLTLPTTSPV